MKQPHKHAELIRAYADGAEIQYHDGGAWIDCRFPSFYPEGEYRIKPEPKPDVVVSAHVRPPLMEFDVRGANIRLTFDGETGKLKDAEVLK